MATYYAIKAFEGMYGGLHGMYDIDVCECADDVEANMALGEMAESIYWDYCDDEYPYEELESDGEYFVVGTDLTKDELTLAQEMAYQDFDGLHEMVQDGKAPWQNKI